MIYGWEFFWAVVASTAGTSGLLALALWLFKTQIAHWLNKDIESIKANYQKELEKSKANHQEELEKSKAGHARELESYRTSLVSEVEERKAEYEIKKLFSLKVHEIRFKNIEIMHGACTLIPSELADFLMTPPKNRDEQAYLKISKRLNEIYESMMRLTMFLDSSEMEKISNMNNFLRIKANIDHELSMHDLNKFILDLQSHISPVHDILTKHMKKMMDMK